jgi:hypothetical protein
MNLSWNRLAPHERTVSAEVDHSRPRHSQSALPEQSQPPRRHGDEQGTSRDHKCERVTHFYKEPVQRAALHHTCGAAHRCFALPLLRFLVSFDY